MRADIAAKLSPENVASIEAACNDARVRLRGLESKYPLTADEELIRRLGTELLRIAEAVRSDEDIASDEAFSRAVLKRFLESGGDRIP